MSAGADRARDLAHRYYLACPFQPRARADEFIVHERQLEAEGRRFGVDPVAAADAGREFVFVRAALNHRQQLFYVRNQEVGALLHLHGVSGVPHVAAGQSEMKPAAGRVIDFLRHRGREADDVMVQDFFEFPLAGEYNVWNATAAAALAAAYGISKEGIAAALKTFKSVKRRLEVKAQVNGITIIDDFAHHPTAIAGTLKALRARYAGARLWAILEPRSNTLRRRVLQNDLARSLALADEVIVAGVFRSEAVPVNERLELPELGADIEKHGRRARLIADADEIVQKIAPEMRSGDVVAILSNGGFGGIYEKLPARLRELASNTEVVIATNNAANAAGKQ